MKCPTAIISPPIQTERCAPRSRSAIHHSAVLVSLAMAETHGLSGRDWLLAQVIANEIEGRVGASVLLGPLNGQLWSFIHLVGGAVIAGKLLGLGAAGIRSAIGVAFLQPPFGLWAPFFGSEGKALLAAPTSVGGVQAAEMAAAGVDGIGDVLESSQGFVAAFTDKPLMGAFGGLRFYCFWWIRASCL